MRVIDCTIEWDSRKTFTMRTGLYYEVTLKDNQFYTGRLHSFCIDGNTLEHLTLTINRDKRVLVFGKDIDSIRRTYVH